MNDQNDFFDDVIGDLDEEDSDLATEVDEFDEDEDEDEDYDDDSEVRTVVMSKNGMIALLSLKISPAGGQIVRVDPRRAAPSAQSYEDSDAAAHWFKRSLATSRKNGWNVDYDGEPLYG
ncbi:MAG TPA: hypothetical protein VM943_02575 [Pyrinomonadaceae bacterium]|nr:hypothetical protein [Pyrinomonadaceae bacterium]